MQADHHQRTVDHDPSPIMTLRAMYARCSGSEPIVFTSVNNVAAASPSPKRSPEGGRVCAGGSSRGYVQSEGATVGAPQQLVPTNRSNSSPQQLDATSSRQPAVHAASRVRPPSASQYSVGSLRARQQAVRPTSARALPHQASPIGEIQHNVYRPRPPSASRVPQPQPTEPSPAPPSGSFAPPKTATASSEQLDQQASVNSQGCPYAIRSSTSSGGYSLTTKYSSSDISATTEHKHHPSMVVSLVPSEPTGATGSELRPIASPSPMGCSHNPPASSKAPSSAGAGSSSHLSSVQQGRIVSPSPTITSGGSSRNHQRVLMDSAGPHPLGDNDEPGYTGRAAPPPAAGVRRGSSSIDTVHSGAGGLAHIVLEPPKADHAQLSGATRETNTATSGQARQLPARFVFSTWIPMSLDDPRVDDGAEGSSQSDTAAMFSNDATAHVGKVAKDDATPQVAEVVVSLDAERSDMLPVVDHQRIEEFLKAVDGDGSISPSIAHDFLATSIDTAMCASGISKPPTEADDLLACTTSSRPLSVPYLWLLFKVYIRLRMFAQRWRMLHRKADGANTKQKDQVQELMLTMDSTNWLQVFNVRWQERQEIRHTTGDSSSCSSNGGTTVPSTQLIAVDDHPSFDGADEDGTTIVVPDMPPPPFHRRSSHSTQISTASSSRRSHRSSHREEGYERAMLHLSSSHVYIASVHSTTSWSIRYNDIVKIVPKPTGVEIQFCCGGSEDAPAVKGGLGDVPTKLTGSGGADEFSQSVAGLATTASPQTIVTASSTAIQLSKSVSTVGASLLGGGGIGSDTMDGVGELAVNTILKSTPSGYFHFTPDLAQASSPQRAPQVRVPAGAPGSRSQQQTPVPSNARRSPLHPPFWNDGNHHVSGSFDNTYGQSNFGNPSSSSPVQGGGPTTKRIMIATSEVSTVAHAILELQAHYLRGFSMSLADRLILKHQTRTLHIVHFNDVYHLPAFKPASARGVVGGAGRFHTVLAKLRETTNPLVLFSGDFMGPSLMSVITKGKQMVDALNFLGVHYGCFGNHEFDFGLRVLKEVIHGYTQGKHIYTGSQTKWVMSNMVEGDDGTPLGGAKPYEITVWNNIRIGILGLCENWLPQCANLHPTEATYLDMFEHGERLAKYLKEVEGAELVFALTHNRNVNDRELAVRCPTIDYIFGGHDHKFKSEPKYRFLKSGQEFEYLSKVEVILAPNRKTKYRIDCTPITYDIKESDYMQGLITRYDAKMAEKLGRVIGKSDVPLDSTEETVRFREGMLTNFILDVIQSTMQTDMAFLGAAAISGKEVMPAGNVTLGDIFGWFPNETKIMTMKLKGSTIKKTLDVMVRELPAEAPSFPHPSQQLRFTINLMTKPHPIVEDIFVRGQPLDLDHEYLCAVEDFVGIGKAKYKHVAAEGVAVVGEDDAVQVVTMVRDFFLKRKASDMDSKDAAALKNVTKIVSSATHIGVDMDMAKSQRFIRSLICELMHCDKSSIFLVDHAEGIIHFVPDNSTTSIRMPLGKGLAGCCAVSCEVLNIEDCYLDPRFNRDVDIKFGYRTKTMLCCPVLLDGRTCSAVVQAINKDNDAVFDEIDELTLRVLGEQVSFQLRYQSIFQEARADLEFHMGWVLDVFRSITSEVCLDLLSGLKVIQTHAASAFRCDNVRVFRFDDESEEGGSQHPPPSDAASSSNNIRGPGRVLYTEEGLDDETIIVPADIHPNSFIADMIKTTTGRLIKDASKTVILRPGDNITCRSVLGIPLMSFMGQCVGIIVVYDKPRGFQPDDEVVARHFGRLSAVAMENCVRLQKILAASSETTLPTVPTLPTDRIRVKGGWATLRRVFRFAKSERAFMRKQGLPLIPLKAFFHTEEKSMHAETTMQMEYGDGGLPTMPEPTLVVEGPEGNSMEHSNRKRTHKGGALASLWGKALRRATETTSTNTSGAARKSSLSTLFLTPAEEGVSSAKPQVIRTPRPSDGSMPPPSRTTMFSLEDTTIREQRRNTIVEVEPVSATEAADMQPVPSLEISDD